MAQPQKPGAGKRQDPKTTLSLLKWTTTLGAVSLTLAGWGLLARAETVNAANAAALDQRAPATLTLGSAAAGKLSALANPAQAAASGSTGAPAVAPSVGKQPASSTRASAPASTPPGTRATRKNSPIATPTAAPTAAPTDNPAVTAAAIPTDTPTAVPTAAPTTVPTPAPTDTPAAKFKLDVVQWVQSQAGEKIAVVRDNQGILWYVWGDDVPRIEQGLSPQYQPVPVNQSGSSRHS